jgi:hypothetical protein
LLGEKTKLTVTVGPVLPVRGWDAVSFFKVKSTVTVLPVLFSPLGSRHRLDEGAVLVGRLVEVVDVPGVHVEGQLRVAGAKLFYVPSSSRSVFQAQPADSDRVPVDVVTDHPPEHLSRLVFGLAEIEEVAY